MDTTRRRRCEGCCRRPASVRWSRSRTSPAFPAWPEVPLDDCQENPMSVQDTIKSQVEGHPIVLYMKGSPQFPQCGFSATATQLLKTSGAQDIFTVDVLQNPEIREGIKQYANWPTIPQLYVNGEFVGGCDIMRELAQSGELQKIVAAAKK